MNEIKNRISTKDEAVEPLGHHSFAQALNHLNKLTEELSDSLHRAINVSRPYLVTDPRDFDKGPMGEAPVPMSSPASYEIRSVNTRLEGILELLTRFGSNFDT